MNDYEHNMSGGANVVIPMGFNATSMIIIMFLSMIMFMLECMDIKPFYKKLPGRALKSVKSGLNTTKHTQTANLKTLGAEYTAFAAKWAHRGAAVKRVLTGKPANVRANIDPSSFGHTVNRRPFLVSSRGNTLTGYKTHTKFSN